jgi:DNA-binding response OmpR family regulator
MIVMTSCEQKILIVEDDPMISDVLRDILVTLGHSVFCTAYGSDAIDLAGHQTLTLAIIDLELPKMNGLEVADKIRGIQPDIRIIFSTGYSEQEDNIDVDDSAIRGIIRKPFEISDIKAAIDEAVSD